MVRFWHQSQPFCDDEHSTAQYDFDNRLLFTQFGEDTTGFFAFFQLRCQRRLAFSLQQNNPLFYLIGYSLHFLQQTVIILSTYAQLFRSKGQGSFINLRHSIQRTFNLGTAISAVQILHQIYSALATQLRTAVTRYYHYVGFNGCADFLNFRQQSLVVSSAEAQLLGSKAYVGIGYARQLFDFIFHLGSAVGTAKVLQNIYAFYLIGIWHTAGAISQAFAAYIAIFLMRMADFAITVSRMTGHVMSVCMFMLMSVVVSTTAFAAVCMRMFMFMFMIVSAATFVTVCVSMFFVLVVVSAATFVTMRVSMFVAVVVSAATFVTMRMSMFVLMTVVVSATTFVAVRMSMFVLMTVVVSAATFVTVCVSVFFVLMAVIMLMFITTTAIIAMFMRMLFMVMVVSASITMSMLRHMSHSVVIMVLAAVTAGAAFRMLAVIFYAIDMTADVSVCSYIVGTVTDVL